MCKAATSHFPVLFQIYNSAPEMGKPPETSILSQTPAIKSMAVIGVSWTQPTAAGSQRRETWSVKVSGLIRLIMEVFRIDPSVYIIESLITRRKWEGTR